MIRDADRMSPVLRSMIKEDHPSNDLTIRLVHYRTRRWIGWLDSEHVRSSRHLPGDGNGTLETNNIQPQKV